MSALNINTPHYYGLIYDILSYLCTLGFINDSVTPKKIKFIHFKKTWSNNYKRKRRYSKHFIFNQGKVKIETIETHNCWECICRNLTWPDTTHKLQVWTFHKICCFQRKLSSNISRCSTTRAINLHKIGNSIIHIKKVGQRVSMKIASKLDSISSNPIVVLLLNADVSLRVRLIKTEFL